MIGTTRFDVLKPGMQFLVDKPLTVLDAIEYLRSEPDFCDHCPIYELCDKKFEEFVGRPFDSDDEDPMVDEGLDHACKEAFEEYFNEVII